MTDSLTPNEGVPSAPRARKRGNRGRLIVVGVIVIAALGFLLFKGLDDAQLYFRTASEAAAERSELGTQRFRIEGTVVNDSITEAGEFTDFKIQDKGVVVDVRNSGQPLGIFQDNIPVVLEGRFADDSDVFMSDQIMVRHEEEYTEEHPDRVSGEDNQPQDPQVGASAS